MAYKQTNYGKGDARRLASPRGKKGWDEWYEKKERLKNDLPSQGLPEVHRDGAEGHGEAAEEAGDDMLR